MHVLEHLPEYKISLGEIHRVIKSDGHFIIEIPNKYSLQEGFNFLYTRIVLDDNNKHLGHCNYFSYKQLEQLLNNSGFYIINSKVKGGLFYGSLNAIFRLFLSIILKGILHRRKQDKRDNEKIEQIIKKISPFYNFLSKIDLYVNKKTKSLGLFLCCICQKYEVTD